MRGVWAASFFAVLAIVLGAIFAWKTTRIELGWDSDRAVVDSGEMRREEAAIAESGKETIPKWIDKMAEPNKALRLPANESEVNIDLVSPEFRENIALILRAENLDRFQKACMRRFFESRNIGFTIAENGANFDIRLAIKDPEKANEMIKELATYDLAAKLVAVKEIKPY